MTELLPGCLDRGDALAPGKWRCRSTRIVIPGGFVADEDCRRCGFRRPAETHSGHGSEPANGDTLGEQLTLEQRLAAPIPRLSLVEVRSLPRHLIYHLYPIRDSVWKENLDELHRRERVFDGRRILTVALDAETVSETAVRETLRGFPADVRFVENVPALGETVSFERMLSEVRNLPGLTFYAHGKGVSRSILRDAFDVWARTMYTLLDRLDEVAAQLTGKGVCGFARQLANRTGDGRFGWHYPGSFYWFRNDAVAARPFVPTKRDRFLSERFPADLFRFEESGTLATQPITGSPYDRDVWVSLTKSQFSAPDSTKNGRSPRPRPRQRLGVAVIVLSHNYGRFLGEAIESVLAQTEPPAEVLVVDDDSRDETAAVATRYAGRGVRLLQVTQRNVHAARRAGLAATTAPVVCFLDADNCLPPEYLSRGLREFNAPDVGVVYCDLERFGDATGRTEFPAFSRETLACDNYVDAGALIRRDALRLSGAFDRDIDPRLTSDDWYIFQRIAAQRWQFRKQTALLRYRVHASQLSQSHPRRVDAPRYYETSGLAHAEVTLFIPLAGRTAIWREQMRPFLERQAWPRRQIRLILCDTSQDPEFSAEVRGWLSTGVYPDARHFEMSPAPRGLADADRRNRDTEADVQSTMCRIYNRLCAAVETDYCWILEDDVIPPDDVLERLLCRFEPDVGSVSAPYPSRWDPGYVTWERESAATGGPIVRVPKPAPQEPQVTEVGGTGFGCIVLRAHLLREWIFTIPVGDTFYDPPFFRHFRHRWRFLCDWTCECRHLGAE